MVMNYKLIEDLVLASGFRPTRPQMFRLYVRVLTTALISYCTSQVFTDMDGIAPFDIGGGSGADISDVNPEDIAGASPELDGEDSLTGFLSRFKIPGVVAESALQGAECSSDSQNRLCDEIISAGRPGCVVRCQKQESSQETGDQIIIQGSSWHSRRLGFSSW